MIVYLFGFITSIILLYFSKIVVKSQRKYIEIFALIIPCVIAGLRANTIGTDITTYLVQMNQAAIHSTSIADYMNSTWYIIWRNLRVSDYEILFSITVYIVTKLFKSICAVQFVLQALVVIPIYLAIKNTNEKLPLWFCFLIYYLMLYNTTLNLMRQSIGMAFFLWAFTWAQKKKYKNAVIIEIIAILFHTSALLGAGIYGIYVFVSKNPKKRYSKSIVNTNNIRMLQIMLVGVIGLISINLISVVISALGLSRYIGYISGTIKIMPNQIISRLPIILLFLLNWKKLKKKERNYQFYFLMLFYDILFLQLSSVNQYSGRIAWYFSQFELLSLPALYQSSNKNKFVLCYIIAYLCFFWWFYYCFSNWGNTIPYKFY